MIPARQFIPHLLFGISLWSCGGANPAEPRLVLVEPSIQPLLTTRSGGAAGNRFGFEGGRALKVGDRYHLFTSEMFGDPVWVKMRLAHWSSANGDNWRRESTLFESSGNFDGTDPRASLWSPVPVYDGKGGRWNLFYVAYRSAPNTSSQFLMNHGGRIWRAVSQSAGPRGVAGPYEDWAVVLEPDESSAPWEGLQGTDSFFPYEAEGEWYALYGSAKTESLPIQSWQVGLARAPELAGPWTRLPGLSPVPIEPVFIENPIVHRDRSGVYLCVYDNQGEGTIGYAFSRDGVGWSPGRSLTIQGENGWAVDVRTPLGLIPEDRGVFTLFFTAFESDPDWDRFMAGEATSTCALGRARLRLVWESADPYTVQQ